MTLPTLYKKTSTGAIQTWSVEFFGKQYCTTFGQENGNLQTSEPTICAGKQGRSDEEQAEFEAKALWTKKLKKDYVKTREEALAGESSELIEGGILPMLAFKYADHATKVKWPVFAQRKLDGHRCIATVDGDGRCTLWSRTRKPILSVPHIVTAVEQQCVPGTVLDGELFATGYNGRFEELTSLIRPSSPKPGHELLEYWVYDCVVDEPFRIRTTRVANLRAPLVSVETVVVSDEDEMRALFRKYIEENFEGLMLRDPDSLYVGKRSTGLLKVKERDDSDFEIVGVEEGRGKLSGHGIFILRTAEGKEFRAKMKGETDALRKYLEDKDTWIGRRVTVAYQGLTADGIPRFPVAIRVHETL